MNGPPATGDGLLLVRCLRKISRGEYNKQGGPGERNDAYVACNQRRWIAMKAMNLSAFPAISQARYDGSYGSRRLRISNSQNTNTNTNTNANNDPTTDTDSRNRNYAHSAV